MRRRGHTIAELIVVLAILGLMAGISGLALASLQAPRESGWLHDLRLARAASIRTGLPQFAESDSPTVRPRPIGSPLGSVLFLPDGRAIGPGIDPLTAVPHAPR